MQLDRSRTALRQATQAVEELRAAKDSPELFRDRFVSTMGMVQRVGSIIDVETKGHRTDEFAKWWKETQSEPLFVFMRDVRHAEFKRGERRQRATHYARATLHLGLSFSAHGEVRDAEGRLKEGLRPSDLPSLAPERRQPKPQATAPEQRERTRQPAPSTDWHFSGGGQFDGQEILSIVDRYLAWLRDEVLPTAERLTR